MRTSVVENEAAHPESGRAAFDLKDKSQQSAHGRPKLTTPAACRYLRAEHGLIITPRTMANHAWAGRGPKFHKCAGRRYYGPDHLDEWALEQLGEPRRSTSDRPQVGG